VALAPLRVGHAVHPLPRLLVVQCLAARLGLGAIPLREAVAAEAGQVHQVDVLDLGMFTQEVAQLAEGRGFHFELQAVVVHGGRLAIE